MVSSVRGLSPENYCTYVVLCRFVVIRRPGWTLTELTEGGVMAVDVGGEDLRSDCNSHSSLFLLFSAV